MSGFRPYGRFGATWTRDAIIEAFQAWAEKHGRVPVPDDWRNAGHGHPCYCTVRRVFDSWAAARDAAGLDWHRKNHAGDWTREEVVDAISRWVFLHGRTPRRYEWLAPPAGFPTAHRVESLFGVWNSAIVASGYEPVRRTRSDHAYRAAMATITKAAA